MPKDFTDCVARTFASLASVTRGIHGAAACFHMHCTNSVRRVLDSRSEQLTERGGDRPLGKSCPNRVKHVRLRTDAESFRMGIPSTITLATKRLKKQTREQALSANVEAWRTATNLGAHMRLILKLRRITLRAGGPACGVRHVACECDFTGGWYRYNVEQPRPSRFGNMHKSDLLTIFHSTETTDRPVRHGSRSS